MIVVITEILTYTGHSLMSTQQDLDAQNFHLQPRKISLREKKSCRDCLTTMVLFFCCMERGQVGEVMKVSWVWSQRHGHSLTNHQSLRRAHLKPGGFPKNLFETEQAPYWSYLLVRWILLKTTTKRTFPGVLKVLLVALKKKKTRPWGTSQRVVCVQRHLPLQAGRGALQSPAEVHRVASVLLGMKPFSQRTEHEEL